MLRLRELREEQGISLDKLGDIFHMQKSTLSRMENGKQEPKADLLNALADYFNVSVDYLLGRTDERRYELKNLKEIESISAHRAGEIEKLSEEGLKELDNYIELLKLKYGKK